MTLPESVTSAEGDVWLRDNLLGGIARRIMSESAERLVMLAFGTRPEAIKMAPLVHALRDSDRYRPYIFVTVQYLEMLDQVLSLFEIVPDRDLNLMEPGQINYRNPTTGPDTVAGVNQRLGNPKPDLISLDFKIEMRWKIEQFHLSCDSQ